MLILSLDALRRLLGRTSPALGGNDSAQTNDTSPSGARALVEERRAEAASNGAAIGKRETGRPTFPNEPSLPTEPSAGESFSSSEITRLVSAYLNARAEEMLAVLLEGVAREATRELRQAVEDSGRSISSDVAEVREGVASSQRELSRIGRELVRSGATLESIQATVSAIGPTVEGLEASLRAELARARQLRRETELAGLDDILLTLDGLEAGLEEGRELLQTLAGAHHRLKDATVQRWWRAMGEATGVKRPLPDVPLDDLESMVAGLELTHRRLLDALVRRGITAIEAVGKPFDPHVHEAVAVEPCPMEQDGLVLREQQRGYRTADRVIRLAQVIVGRGQQAKTGAKRGRPRKVPADQSTEGPEPGASQGNGHHGDAAQRPSNSFEESRRGAEGECSVGRSADGLFSRQFPDSANGEDERLMNE